MKLNLSEANSDPDRAQATFRSKCATCGEWIEEDDWIVKDEDDNWIHEDCQ